MIPVEESLDRLRDADIVAFTARFHYLGNELNVITCEADVSGYRAVARLGKDAASGSGNSVVHIEASNGEMRVRFELAGGDGFGPWRTDNSAGRGFGLAAFHPDGTDYITVLKRLPTGRSVHAAGSQFTVLADLETVYQALTGLNLQTARGEPAIPVSSSVLVDVALNEPSTLRVHFDGGVVSKRLQELNIDPSGLLARASHTVAS